MTNDENRMTKECPNDLMPKLFDLTKITRGCVRIYLYERVSGLNSRQLAAIKQ